MVRVHFPRWTCTESTLSALDIHPDGTRFVSAVNGTQRGSSKLTFWNMDPIRNVDSEQPKVLCEKEISHASVNCVRWSGAGHMLASAEDDSVVIWCYSKSIESSFGSKVANVENWKDLHDLRGHQGNVFDLRWSPHDRFLASCCVDNKIYIWNARNFRAPFRTLSGHTNLVKGLCWDPLGNFLASQSDDRTMRVWRTSDWGEECKISKPFTRHSPTHYLRCDWSPDGQYLVSSHAINEEGPVAVALSRRDKFNAKMDFAGHRRPITCVRFHSKLIRMKGSNQLSCLLAIASKDRSVSFWLASQSRAFLTLHELVDDEVVDISWAQSSLELGVCSLRGKIMFVLFSETEVGSLLTADRQERVLRNLYGDEMNSLNVSSVLVSDPDMFPYLVSISDPGDKENKISPLSQNNSKKGQSLMTSSSLVSTTQQEIRSKDGKRRIVPVCLDLPDENVIDADVIEAPVPFRGRQEKTNSEQVSDPDAVTSDHITSTTAQSPMDVSNPIPLDDLKVATFKSLQARLTEINCPEQNTDVNQNRSTGLVEIPPPAREDQTVSPDSSTVERTVVVAENRGKEDEVRILDSVPGMLDSAGGLSVVNESEKDAINKTIKISKAKKLKLNALKASTSKSAPTLFQSQGAKKRKRVFIDDDDDEVSKYRNNEISGWANSKLYADDDSQDDEDENDDGDDEMYSPIFICEPARVQDSFEHLEANCCVKVTNNVSYGTLAPCLHVVEMQNQQNLSSGFKVSLTDPVVCVSCSQKIVAIACSDDSIHVYDHTGNMLAFPFIVDANISQLSTKEFVVMAVTCEVTVSVWDVDRKKGVVVNYQLTNLFKSPTVKLKSAYLSDDGSPVVVTTAQKAYTFDSHYESWVLIQDPGWSFTGKQASSATQSAIKSAGMLRSLAELCADPLLKSAVLDVLDKSRVSDPENASRLENLSAASNVRYCQMQEMLAIRCGSGFDFKNWTLELVHELSRIGNEEAIRTKLDQLLENVVPCDSVFEADSSSDNYARLGLRKSEVLKEALAVVAKNAQNQKVFSEYNQIVKQIL